MKQGKLTDEEEVQLAKEYREFEWQEILYADDRSNKISDSFREIELQIAALVFAFSTTFLRELLENIPSLFKIFFGIGIVSLVVSLLFGLVNEHVKSSFWKEVVKKRFGSFQAFDKVVNKKSSLEVALAFHNAQTDGGVKRLESSQLPFILQTFFLVLGLLLNLVIILFLIFT